MALIEIVSMDRLIKPVGEWDWIDTYAWLVWFDRLEDWLLRVVSLLLLFVQSFGEFFFFLENLEWWKKKEINETRFWYNRLTKRLKIDTLLWLSFEKVCICLKVLYLMLKKKIVRSNFKRLFYFKGWSNIFWIVNLNVCDMR